jgi:hypothetical protein
MAGQSLFVPVLAPVLRDRRMMFAILGAAVLQLGLSSLKVSGWRCPILHFFGVPCPGCGLTRATLLLFHGDWQRSIAFHAFAPVFVFAMFLIFGAVTLPQNPRERVINFTEAVERRTGITTILLLGLIVYWLARLLIMQSTFVKLIQ